MNTPQISTRPPFHLDRGPIAGYFNRMLSVFLPSLFAGALAHAHVHAPPTDSVCEGNLYYRGVIERVIRTGQVPIGWVNDHTTYQDFVDDFGRAFGAAVRGARRDDTWINFGAGRALAEREVIEGLVPTGGLRVISVSAHRPEDAVYAGSPRHTYHAGQMIEEMDWSDVPKAQLGTDRFGPLSYSPEFDLALKIEGEALAVGAPLFVEMQTGRTRILFNGREVPISEFLGDVRGLKLEGPIRYLPGRAHLMTFVLRRVEGPVRVPALRLRRLKYQLPPLREYDWFRVDPERSRGAHALVREFQTASPGG